MSRRRTLINRKVAFLKGKRSNLIKHAKYEFYKAGFNSNGMDAIIRNNILELLTVFADQGHSGFSAGIALQVFNKLAKFQTLSPLTFDHDEWNYNLGFYNDSPNSAIAQNIRDSRFFLYNGDNIAFNDDYVKQIVQGRHYGEKTIRKYAGGTFSGRVFIHKKGIATGEHFYKCWVKPELYKDKSFSIPKTITLPCTEIEVQPDDFLMFVSDGSAALKELQKNYIIQWEHCHEIAGQEIKTLDHNYGY